MENAETRMDLGFWAKLLDGWLIESFTGLAEKENQEFNFGHVY